MVSMLGEIRLVQKVMPNVIRHKSKEWNLPESKKNEAVVYT